MFDVTRILWSLEQGDPQAAEKLLPLVYDELRSLARSKLQHEQPGQTLQATALVHEAYLRLAKPPGAGSPESSVGLLNENLTPDAEHVGPAFHSRGHFFGAAAEAMRRILVDAARRKRRLKRGGHFHQEPLDDEAIVAPEIDHDLLELDAALDQLQCKDARKAALVKLRYFAGLTIEEAARELGISTTTADRDWSYARAWLFRELSKGGSKD